MAVDGYVFFQGYDGNYLKSESQVQPDPATTAIDKMYGGYAFDKAQKAGGLFEIDDFSFDIEQTLNIGSQSTGAGAGKVTFNPFQVNRPIDRSSPELFQMACAGKPFQDVRLGLRKSAGGGQSGIIYLVFCFKLVAVKSIAWSYDDTSPKEALTFEYGALMIFYSMQKPDGTLGDETKGGWNRVKNIMDQSKDDVIK